MRCFTAPAVLSGHCSFWLLIVQLKDAASHRFTSFRNRKLAPKLDRLQRRVIFSRWNSKIAWEIGKSSRQRQYFNWSVHSFCFEINAFLNTKKRTELICTPNIYTYIYIYIIFFCRVSSCNKPRHALRILERRFIISTAYKYLGIGIVMGPVFFVEIIIGNNQGNNIILSRAIWQAFMEIRANIERFVQSIVLSSLSIQALVIKIVKCVMWMSNQHCLYIKPSTVLFMFELKHYVENIYSELC